MIIDCIKSNGNVNDNVHEHILIPTDKLIAITLKEDRCIEASVYYDS